MKTEQMSEGEKVHFLTEGIYRNLIDNFNPGIRQIIISGRSFQKALHNVATTAKVYIDTIYNIAQNAQMCKGATSEIGAALLQVAEVHKEINTQVIDNIKTFHAELLIPLETKQENDFKQTSSIYKKYIAGHKYHSVPVEKAQTALKKYRKKHKAAKYGFDQKDFQFSREVKEHQAKLDEYRVTSLRHALLEERKRYCFLLDRICAIVRSLASHHSKAHELLTHRLQEWSTHSLAPHILPEASEAVIGSFKIIQFQDEMFAMAEEALRNEGQAGGSTGSTDSPYERQEGPTMRDHILYGHSAPPSLHYGTSNMFTSESDYAVHMMMTSQPMVPSPQVRALYNHHGNNSTQLNFAEGDVIALIGEKKDGWHYGKHTGNNRMGWFPIAFTQQIESNGTLTLHNRHRSLGNLSSLGQGSGVNTPEPPDDLPPDPGSNYLQRSHTITERPMSLYATREPPGQPKMAPSDRPLTWVCLDGQHQGRPLPGRPDMLIYQHTQHTGSLADLHYQHTIRHSNIPSPYNQAPTPPPPPPPPTNQGLPLPPPPIAPPVPPAMMTQSMSAQVISTPQESIYGHIRPPANGFTQPNHHSPPQSSSGYSGSSNRVNQSSNDSHSNQGIYSTPGGFPPPPPALVPQAPASTSDYEEPPGENPFANVQLKKATTSDRSAPRIH